MKFDKFQDTQDQGRRIKEKVERTTASQGSRRDANLDPVDAIQFESYEEESNHLKSRKLAIQEELSQHYSKAAFTNAQAKVRQQFHNRPNESIKEWLRLRSSMQEKRNALAIEAQTIDNRLVQIKSKVINERNLQFIENNQFREEVSHENWVHNPSYQIMINLLTEIRDLLASRKE